MNSSKKVLLTGDRPSGKLHLGHYFGSLKNRVRLQDEYECFFIIADVQALTDNFETPEKVRESVRDVVIDNLSVGIDPEKSNIFIQSMIPEIAELTVFYSNLVSVSRLQRNPTVKSEMKNKKNIFGEKGEGLTYGFLGYPVSQAADITAFDGEIVPVGDDQLPMVEQTREIVRKFNSIYGRTLLEPDPMLSDTPRIKGLDGGEKMGKSLGNAVYLSDSEDEVTNKIMKALTDKNKIRKDDPGNPEECMVYYYHKLFATGQDLSIIKKECIAGNRGCVECKRQLSSNINNFLDPIRAKRNYYLENPDVVDKIILKGNRAASEKAGSVMSRVKKNMKINYF